MALIWPDPSCSFHLRLVSRPRPRPSPQHRRRRQPHPERLRLRLDGLHAALKLYIMRRHLQLEQRLLVGRVQLRGDLALVGARLEEQQRLGLGEGGVRDAAGMGGRDERRDLREFIRRRSVNIVCKNEIYTRTPPSLKYVHCGSIAVARF